MGIGCGRCLPEASGGHWKIAYVSDVEGHWDFFCNFVEICHGLRFARGDGREARTAHELELELEEDWCFVFGGDASDKGPGTLRVVMALVALKKKHPERVFLILGNRDINKMRFTSELATSELERVKEVPRAFWQSRLPGNCPTYWEYLKRKLQDEGVKEDEVTDKMVYDRSSKASKLRYLLDCDMGSAGDFEFRREELAHLKNVAKGDVTDEEVVRSYEESVAPGGSMRQLLEMGQLALLLEGTLFVHGQIIGNQFPHDQVIGADEQNVAWSVGVVPGENWEGDLQKWVQNLNSWAASQIRDWKQRPLWATPPVASAYQYWSQRGGSELIAYGTPGTHFPTVVYCRYLAEQSMPLQYPRTLVDYLKTQGVRYVMVGHTPHGNAPTVIRHDSLTLIMADTSFSDVKANRFYQGDNRGSAVCAIEFNGRAWSVRGQTDKDQCIDYTVGQEHRGCDPLVGRFTKPDSEGKVFFVKAKLCGEGSGYLLSRAQGFTYEYVLLSAAEVKGAIQGGSFHFVTELAELEFLEEDVLLKIRHLFQMLGAEEVWTFELEAAVGDRLFRRGLRSIFPSLDPIALAASLSRTDGKITPQEFHELCRAHSSAEVQNCLLFPVAPQGQTAVLGNFPKALPFFTCMPPTHVKPAHLSVFKGHLATWKQLPRRFECHLEGLQSESSHVKTFFDMLRQHDRKRIVSSMSAIADVNVGEFDRNQLQIPDSGKYIAWSHPFALSHWDWEDPFVQSLLVNPDVAFFTMGSFVYFDEKYEPVHINAIVPHPSGSLRFGPPQPLSHTWAERQLTRGNFQPVMLHSLLCQGASDYTWLPPGHKEPDCPYGGFAYLGKGLSMDTSEELLMSTV